MTTSLVGSPGTHGGLGGSVCQPSIINGYARNISESAYPSLWNGLVACWAPFMGNTGNKLWDYSGRRNHGVMTGFAATAWKAGWRGWSLKFAAGSELITCGTSLCDLNKVFSIFACARFADTTSNSYPIMTATANPAVAYMLFQHRLSTTGMTMFYDLGPGGGTNTTSPSDNITANKWHAVALTRDQYNTRANLYQDGRPILGETRNLTFSPSTGQTWCIGSWNPAGNVMNGEIDFVALYERSFYQSDINLLTSGATPLHLNEHWSAEAPAAAAAAGYSFGVFM